MYTCICKAIHLISINVDCNLYIVIIRIIKFMLAIIETTSYHFCMPSSYIASSTCTHYPMYTWETCQKHIYGANPLHIFKNFYSMFYHICNKLLKMFLVTIWAVIADVTSTIDSIEKMSKTLKQDCYNKLTGRSN